MGEKLCFASDYMEGAHPAIMQRLVATNLEQTAGYGQDAYSAAAREKIRAACPEALYRVSEILPFDGHEICDSSTRYGSYILTADTQEQMTEMLHMSGLEEELL